jgi:two-component system cell cycle sensor histidine kinase/response regulator CckA
MDYPTQHVAELPSTTGSVRPWLEWKGSGGVLVIDDDESVRTVLQRTLARIGFTVSLAADGKEALELFNADPSRYRVVLLDYKLPGMDANAILAGLRARRPAIPVIVMSGYTREDAGEAGAMSTCDFLHKPFTMALLAAKVRKALGD